MSDRKCPYGESSYERGMFACRNCGEDLNTHAIARTPPADDVREALAELLVNERGMNEGVVADRIREAFEVRPHGTVTDAEVEAAAGAICQAAEGESLLSDLRMGMRDQYMREARAALEAARNA